MPVMQMAGNVFLVGLMGAGKTTVGKLLAKRLAKTFVDSDQELESRTGVRIPLIFEMEGEAGFRQREALLLAELVKQSDIVLATGGGIVLNPANRQALKAHGTVVYLHASAENLWERTRHDKHRPLLQTADPLGKLHALLAERDPLYREVADLVIESNQQNVHTLAQLVVKKLRAQTVTDLPFKP